MEIRLLFWLHYDLKWVRGGEDHMKKWLLQMKELEKVTIMGMGVSDGKIMNLCMLKFIYHVFKLIHICCSKGNMAMDGVLHSGQPNTNFVCLRFDLYVFKYSRDTVKYE